MRVPWNLLTTIILHPKLVPPKIIDAPFFGQKITTTKSKLITDETGAEEVSRMVSAAVAEFPDGFLFHADFSGEDEQRNLQNIVDTALITSLHASHQDRVSAYLHDGNALPSPDPRQASIAPTSFDDAETPQKRVGEVSKKKLQTETALTYTEPDIPLLREAIPFVAEGISDLVDDEFNQCFEHAQPRPWNWGYLGPFWLVGLLVRCLILLPLRVCVIILATIVLAAYFVTLRGLKMSSLELESKAMTIYAQALMLAFGAVVSYHGVRPRTKSGQVFVANHTTMLDFVVLLGLHPFSVVGQLHSGLVGWFQLNVFSCLQCVWFDRKSAKDRALVRRKIQEHVANSAVPPLCIFPEGTCVNNRFLVQFKRGAFELENVDVYPIAIKYNLDWADGFWDSRNVSFVTYLIDIMASWCLVVDVYFLAPERRQEGETPTAFAERVKAQIGRIAGLTPVPWDGYLKHIRPSARYVKERQKEAAQDLLSRLGTADRSFDDFDSKGSLDPSSLRRRTNTNQPDSLEH